MPVNPFERFDLDIGASLAELTRALRERIEDAETDAERAQLREIWEALTGKLETRAALVLDTLPKLAEPLEPGRARLAFVAKGPHPLDEKPLPPFPVEWAALEPRSRTEPGHIDLQRDAAFAHLEHVVLP